MNDDIKDVILSAFEASLYAQLRAIRRLRQGQTEEAQPRPRRGRSQVDMAYDILKKARGPLACYRDHRSHPQSVQRCRRSREPGFFTQFRKKVARQDRCPAPRKEHFLAPVRSPMKLPAAFLSIVEDWQDVFPQQRTYQRTVRQALGSLICLGRRCISRIIWTNGGKHRSWSAEYFLHSRCSWEPQQLFQPILKRALAYCPQRLVGVAVDDTKLRKTGRSIQQAFYQRDLLSPPFHVNLVLGLRFLQASLLVPLHRTANVGTRALPIRFQEVSRVKRPGKKAITEEQKQYKAAVKVKNLSHSFVQMGKQLREELDLVGGPDKCDASALAIATSGSHSKNSRTGPRTWMSLVVPGIACREVNASSPRNSSRKKICETLRHSGNLDPDTSSSSRSGEQAYVYRRNDRLSDKCRAVMCITECSGHVCSWIEEQS